ncbi:uncharacterized protein LOC144255713 [Urocitellus parryii]
MDRCRFSTITETGLAVTSRASQWGWVVIHHCPHLAASSAMKWSTSRMSWTTKSLGGLLSLVLFGLKRSISQEKGRYAFREEKKPQQWRPPTQRSLEQRRTSIPDPRLPPGSLFYPCA